MVAAECSLRIFMQALFEGKLDAVGGKEEWDVLYTTYVDLSGMADSKICTILRQIHQIDVRLASINTYIAFQVEWYKFSLTVAQPQPAIEFFDDFKEYGHRLTWTGNWENFEAQLKRIESKEKKRVAQKDGLLKEYAKLKKEGLKADNITKDERKEFIRLMNIIAKHNGYALDKDKVMVDEFAIMVKDYNTLVEQQNSQI